MSTPEWMQKFKQIGQKGEEEVTTVGEGGGLVTTVQPPSLDPIAASETKEDEFKVMPSPQGGNDGDMAAFHDDDDDDAAALFHAAAGSSAGTLSEATPLGSEGSDYFDDPDAASSFPAGVGGTDYGARESTAGEAPYSSEGPRLSVETDEEEAAGMFRSTGHYGEEKVDETTAAAAAAAAAAFGTDDGNEGIVSNDDIGESWVVDKDRFLNVEMKDEFAEEEVSYRNLGEEHYEDVYVDDDDDGNEILVDEDGNEVQEEEVLVDDDGNEIDVDDEYFNDEPQAAAAVVAVATDAERAVMVAPQPQAYVHYDIEDQRKVLQTTARGRRSHMSSMVPILAFLVLVSAVLLVVFLVGLDMANKHTSGQGPSMAPTPMQYLPLNPTNNGNIEAAATTLFDPYQNSCDFGNLPQPSFIDQCACIGAVEIIADDVRVRRENLMDTFMPSVLPEWNETASSCTAENQALLWLSSGINNGGETTNLLRLQRFALAFLYVAQGGTEWRENIGWLSEQAVCDWINVECDDNSYVRFLNLNGNRLRGQVSPIPSTRRFRVNRCSVLTFFSLNPQLSEAAALLNAIDGFFVAQNDLFGSIPPSYCGSSSLRSIDFSSNTLSGEIPPLSESNPLTSLNLESNSLSGLVPPGLVNANNLTSFNVALNALSGTLPNGLFDLPLTELAIGGNLFNGTLPDDLRKATTLTSLSLGPNLFTGQIPTSLGELSSLERLSITGIPGLGGRLPASYGISLTKLVELSITETSVSGNIPEQFAGMTDLTILRLSSNSLGRLVTPALGQLSNLGECIELVSLFQFIFVP
jgi:hypothetical protein